MTPAVMRRSGPDFYENGKRVTPRAMIASCEVCGFEHAPYGFKDAQGNRTFYCKDHRPEAQSQGDAQ